MVEQISEHVRVVYWFTRMSSVRRDGCEQVHGVPRRKASLEAAAEDQSENGFDDVDDDRWMYVRNSFRTRSYRRETPFLQGFRRLSC